MFYLSSFYCGPRWEFHGISLLRQELRRLADAAPVQSRLSRLTKEGPRIFETLKAFERDFTRL